MIDLCHHSSIYLPRSQKKCRSAKCHLTKRRISRFSWRRSAFRRVSLFRLTSLARRTRTWRQTSCSHKTSTTKKSPFDPKIIDTPISPKNIFFWRAFLQKERRLKKDSSAAKTRFCCREEKNPGSGTLCWLNNLSSSRGFSFSPGFVSGNELSQFFRSSSSVHSLAENEFRFFRDFRLFSNQRLNPIFLKLAFFRETCFEICQQCQQTIIF